MSLSLASTIRLNDGRALPRLGLGVYLSKGAEGITAICTALEAGYRHIDSAAFYDNEKEVGEAVHKWGGERDSVWLTSKIWDSDHGYERCSKAVDRSLKKLGLPSWDLMLLHSPNPGKAARLEAWRALIDAKKAGKVRSIGVSNYGVHHIQELLEAFPQDPPAVNQIELSPFFQRASIVAECAKHDIVVESYSPLGKGAFVDLPELQDIAKKYGKTPSHILIRYVLQKDIVVLPKSVNPDRIKANADVYGFELDAEDMKTLDGFETGSGITWDPTTAP